MHIKNIHSMIEKMAECTKSAIENNDTHVGQYPVSEVVDMIKDLSEAEYYSKISKAMDESEYGQDYDEHGRLFYRGQRRDSMGRYTSRGGRRGYEEYMMPPMYYEDPIQWGRDMDMSHGRMYYSDGSSNVQGSNSGRQSRYGFAHDQYMEKREKHTKASPEDHSKRMELLNDFMDDLEDMARDVVKGMSPEEKQTWRSKLNKIINM